MKTINIKKKRDLEIFVDAENRSFGFAGAAQVYDAAIHIDTRNGTGYQDVINKLAPLIHKFMSKYRFIGNRDEDTRQDIILFILEGIPMYDPRKQVKLSTFLEMRINRRLINHLRNKTKIYKNATFLNVSSFKATCACGASFVVAMPDDDSDIICDKCGNKVESKKKMHTNSPEVNESSLFNRLNANVEFSETLDGLPLDDYNIIGNSPVSTEDKVILKEDLDAFLENEDEKLVEIINLIYYQDYSVKDAAEKVGISGAGASMKLKNLQNNKIIKELFNR